MRIGRRLCLIFAAATCLAVPAQAQDAVAPRVEVGAIASGVVPFAPGEGAFGLAAGGPVVTIRVFRRIRVDLFGEALGPTEQSGITALYQAHVRFPVRGSRDGAGTLFVTAGTGGLFATQRVHESRRTRPDGSIIVHPGFRRSRLAPPRLVSAGIMHQRVLNRRASLILGAQTMVGQGAIVLRGSAGLSFALRNYR